MQHESALPPNEKCQGMSSIILKDRFYFPKNMVNLSKVRKNYEEKTYEEQDCKKCPIRPNRHCEKCDDCPAYLGIVSLWQEVSIKEKKYIAVPSGDPESVFDRLDLDLDWDSIRDKRKPLYFETGLKFTGDLYDGSPDEEGNPRPNQVKITRRWLKKAKRNNVGGLIKSSTRSGKTVMATYLACKLRMKTFITARQIDWLRQFCLAISNFTNLKAIVKRRGGVDNSPVVMIDPNGWPDGEKLGVRVVKNWKPGIEKADILIGCYQGLINKKKGLARIRDYINDQRSFLVVDEVDQVGAFCFSKVINRTGVKYKCGLTATTERKDGKERIVESIIGKVISEGKVSSMTPEIQLWETGIKVPQYKQWHSLEKFLVESRERNVQIIRQVYADLRSDPKNCVLIATNRVAHVKNLVQMINHQAKVLNLKGEKWPKRVAIDFRAGIDRNHALAMAKSRSCRVVVAISRMAQRGLDVPAWTHTYILIPGSNPPIFNQLANRCATIYPGKKTAIVRVMIDNTPISIYCLRSLVYPKVAKNYGIANGIKENPPLYKIKPDQLVRLRQVINNPKSYSFSQAPEFTQLGKSRSEREKLIKQKKKWSRF